MVADQSGDALDGDDFFALDFVVLQYFLGGGHGDVSLQKECSCHECGEDAFQVANGITGVVAQVFEDAFGHMDLFFTETCSGDGEFELEIWRLKVDRDAPFKARDEALFHVFELLDGAVGGQDDLALQLVHVVEDVEEDFLSFGASS